MVEWVKQGALRWFGHMVRMNENEFVKRVYHCAFNSALHHCGCSISIVANKWASVACHGNTNQ